jgi:hypothetical protein
MRHEPLGDSCITWVPLCVQPSGPVPEAVTVACPKVRLRRVIGGDLLGDDLGERLDGLHLGLGREIGELRVGERDAVDGGANQPLVLLGRDDLGTQELPTLGDGGADVQRVRVVALQHTVGGGAVGTVELIALIEAERHGDPHAVAGVGGDPDARAAVGRAVEAEGRPVARGPRRRERAEVRA